MKRAVELAFLIMLATPADAAASTAPHCHRFSIWKYPYPQRCKTSLAAKRASPFVASLPIRDQSIDRKTEALRQALASKPAFTGDAALLSRAAMIAPP